MKGLFGGLVAAWHQQNQIRAREIESRLYPEKRRVYGKAINDYMEIVSRNSASGRSEIPARDIAKIMGHKRELMLFASAGVIRAWNHMEKSAGEGGPDVLRAFDSIVREMRRDLGYDDSELEVGELFSLILKAEDKDKLVT